MNWSTNFRYLPSTLTYGNTSIGRPAKPCFHELCADTECRLEVQPRVMLRTKESMLSVIHLMMINYLLTYLFSEFGMLHICREGLSLYVCMYVCVCVCVCVYIYIYTHLLWLILGELVTT